MTNNFKIILMLLILCLKVSIVTAQNYAEPHFQDPERLKKIQKLIPSLDILYSNYAKNNHIPGCCYAIVVDGKLTHTKCYGYADVANKIPATPKTVFRLASLSKSFTAIAILKLRDTGKLNLDDPVYLYIPSMKGQKLTKDSPEITIHDLLVHAAGLPEEDPWSDRKLSEKTEDLLALINNGLLFSNVPELKFEYSSLSYSILGYIITKVSGLPYQDYIAQNIWQPLNMQTATWEYSTIPAPNLAHGYRWENSAWVAEPILHDGAHGAMGGMWASIEDFSKYVALHQNAWPASNQRESGPVSRATLRTMQQPWQFDQLNLNYKLIDGTSLPYTRSYGYGLFWMQDGLFKNYVLHPGSLPGYHAHWQMLPDYGLAVIVFGNIKNAPRFDVNMQALNTLVKGAKLSPRVLPASEFLLQSQAELMRVLPDWDNINNNPIFAVNFFLDFNINDLRKMTKDMFAVAGKIKKIGTVIPENQLRGSFILEGEKRNLKITFALTPENPPLIQQFNIEYIK